MILSQLYSIWHYPGIQNTFSFGLDAIVRSKSLISGMLFICIEACWFTASCVIEEQLPVGYILLV